MTNSKILLLAAIMVLAVALVLLTGCETTGVMAVDLSAPYKPDNVFLTASKLPGDVKRVAVLPLACDERQTDLVAGREALQPVLVVELVKSKKFEVVEVSPEELWRLTGRADWTGAEILPADFLAALNKACGCDAVLFSELTEFHPYPPLAVGWRLKLVDIRRKETIWAGDEHFDAGKPAVMAAARHYQQEEQRPLEGDTTIWLAANSPRWFGQYSIASLLDTLPAR